MKRIERVWCVAWQHCLTYDTKKARFSSSTKFSMVHYLASYCHMRMSTREYPHRNVWMRHGRLAFWCNTGHQTYDTAISTSSVKLFEKLQLSTSYHILQLIGCVPTRDTVLQIVWLHAVLTAHQHHNSKQQKSPGFFSRALRFMKISVNFSSLLPFIY